MQKGQTNNSPVLVRSRNDIQQSYIREWQKTTARDGNIKPQTVLSTLWFVPIWLKYNAVPDILRYAWYIVWVQIVAAYRRYHAWAVLQGVSTSHKLQSVTLPLSCTCLHVVHPVFNSKETSHTQCCSAS